MPKQGPDKNSRGASPGRIWVISFLVWLGLTYTPGVNVKNYAVEAVVGLLLTGAISILSVGYTRVERPAKSLIPKGLPAPSGLLRVLTRAII